MLIENKIEKKQENNNVLIVKAKIRKEISSLKCPICEDLINYSTVKIDDFTICPVCLTPYHRKCLTVVLSHTDSSQKCWVCNSITLGELLNL
jgi:hypothetical protein